VRQGVRECKCLLSSYTICIYGKSIIFKGFWKKLDGFIESYFFQDGIRWLYFFKNIPFPRAYNESQPVDEYFIEGVRQICDL
jgi:hypothetical protein